MLVLGLGLYNKAFCLKHDIHHDLTKLCDPTVIQIWHHISAHNRSHISGRDIRFIIVTSDPICV
jgi:hypothetical protein